eukprot:TRINITY_DN427_c0_g1_i4.p1 TRINITY_DN427_c0_g1~~TRINITY_DN427_c0_g1_i4.p1  ORF type:complete len:799 (+),score=68.59 TRINITY_DN427_c0_g1_i4:108-2399(+)
MARPALGALLLFCASAQATSLPNCTDIGGGCWRSPNDGWYYRNNDRCSVPLSPGWSLIRVIHFDTERGIDNLTVDGTLYSGEDGPHLVTVRNNLTWRTDNSVARYGWTICLSPAALSCAVPGMWPGGRVCYVGPNRNGYYPTDDPAECQQLCQSETCCKYWVVQSRRGCYLRYDHESSIGQYLPSPWFIAGPKFCSSTAYFTRFPTSSPTGFPTLYPTPFPTTSPTAVPNCEPLGNNCWRTGNTSTGLGVYRDNASCSIPLPGGAPSRITVERFNTEVCCDHLIVDGARYSGTNSPHDVFVHSSLEWTTDSTVGSTGWQICLQPQAETPSSSPTGAPVLLPTAAPTGTPISPPTVMPTVTTIYPSSSPTGLPTGFPTTGFPTTDFPTTGFPTTGFPTTSPTGFPTTGFPTTGFPTTSPTGFPTTGFPTSSFPTTSPTGIPTDTRYPTQTPTEVGVSTEGPVRISTCVAGAGRYTVNGVEQDSPCNSHGDRRHVDHVSDFNGIARVYTCSRNDNHHFVLCTCRGAVCAENEEPANCFVPTSHAAGCVGMLRGAAFSSDGTKVFFACSQKVRVCKVDLSNRNAQPYSDCQLVDRARCPRWAAIRGIAARPRPGRGDLLAVVCTDSPTWKTRACSLDADNMRMQPERECVKGGPEPLCQGLGKPAALAFSPDGRLLAPCGSGYSYARLVGGIVQDAVHTAYNGISDDRLSDDRLSDDRLSDDRLPNDLPNPAPCPRETRAIANSGPGRAVVACGPDGVRHCLIRYD